MTHITFLFNNKKHAAVPVSPDMIQQRTAFAYHVAKEDICFEDGENIAIELARCKKRKQEMGRNYCSVGSILFYATLGKQTFALFSTIMHYAHVPPVVSLYENELEFYDTYQVKNAIDMLCKQPRYMLYPFVDTLFELLCEVNQEKLRKASHDVFVSQMDEFSPIA